MTVVVDINVMLDVFQRRMPHYTASAAFMNLVVQGSLEGICPAHALTTLYYLARRHGTHQGAEAAIDVILARFRIVALEHADWQVVRRLPLSDFEDAAVAVTAQKAQAAFIITRNEADFLQSPVPAVSPAVFLSRFRAMP